MGWKGVELQVALPRTQDAGQLQDQMSHRGQLTQEHLAQSQIKAAEKNRKKVIETNEEEKVMNEKEESEQDQQQNQETNDSNKKSKNKAQSHEKHPYLGNIIDYSG